LHWHGVINLLCFFFFEKSGGARGSYCNFIKKLNNRVQNLKSRQQKTEEGRGFQGTKKEMKKIMKIINEIGSVILRGGAIPPFVLCSNKSDSTVTYLLQSATEGFLFLKMTSFLIIQMAQQSMMKMSREKATFRKVFQA